MHINNKFMVFESTQFYYSTASKFQHSSTSVLLLLVSKVIALCFFVWFNFMFGSAKSEFICVVFDNMFAYGSLLFLGYIDS